MKTPNSKRKRQIDLFTIPLSSVKSKLNPNRLDPEQLLSQQDSSFSPTKLQSNGDIISLRDGHSIAVWLSQATGIPVASRSVIELGDMTVSNIHRNVDMICRSSGMRELIACSDEGRLSLLPIRGDGHVIEAINHDIELEGEDETVTVVCHAGFFSSL